MDEAWVVDAVRTPIGRIHGQLAGLEVQHLLAPLITALVQRNGLQAAKVDEVIVGNAAGPGGNPARLALLQAGLPLSVPGLTIDRQCGSGLEAINLGLRLVQSGAASIVLAGGVESPSTAPLRAKSVQHKHGGAKRADATQFYHRARFAPDEIGDPEMGVAAENVARRYAIDRQRQDRFALRSHQKAIAAQSAGLFDNELISVFTGNLDPMIDECPRADTSLAQLAALKPAFSDNGSVTPGNACPVNDGAALVLIVSKALAQRDNLRENHSRRQQHTAALRFIDSAAAGVDPNYLGLGPVPAVEAVLRRVGMVPDDFDQIEFNEAFAAQVLACMDLLKLDHQRLNPAGGALALGHPFGASGAILVTRLLHSLNPGQRGLATIGIGGGLGLASVFEAV